MPNHFTNLRDLSKQFRRMGDNYFSLNNDGQVNKTTNTGVGRFFKRVAAAFSSSARAENQRTVDALMAQIRSVPGLGTQLAESLSEHLGARARQGKPISARDISHVLFPATFRIYPLLTSDAIAMFIMNNVDADDGYLSNLIDTLNLPDPRDRDNLQTNAATGTSMSDTADSLLASLELKMLSSVDYIRFYGSDSMERLAGVHGKDVIRQFVLEHYVKTNGEELYARMVKRHDLDTNAMDKNAFMKRMTQFSNELDTPDLNPETFQAFMDGEADKFANDFAVNRFEKRFFDSDNHENAFFNAYKEAAAARYPQARPEPDAVIQLGEAISVEVNEIVKVSSGQVMTEKELEAECSDLIDAYFDGVDDSVAFITDPAERARISASMITLGVLFPPDQMKFVQMFTQAVAQTLEASVKLKNFHLVQESFKTLTGVGSLFDTMGQGMWEESEMEEMVRVASLAGFAAAGENLNGAGNLARAIMAPDSPFIDYFETVSKSHPRTPDYPYAEALLTVVSKQFGYKVGMEDLSFRDLSLFRKREILGHTQPVSNGYSDKKLDSIEAMQRIRAAHRTSANSMLTQHLPNYIVGLQPNAPVDAGFSDIFIKDFYRDGCIVNGTYHSGQDNNALASFISAFPSKRDALIVSTFLTQQFHAAYIVAANSESENFLLEMGTLQGEQRNTGQPVIPRSTSYRVISEGNGRYRISSESLSLSTESAQDAMEDNNPAGFQSHLEVVLDVNNPQAVLSSDVDFLFFGYDI